MAKSTDIIELTTTDSASKVPCRIVIDSRTQRFLERAEDKPLLDKPKNCDGDEYSLCHLSLAPLIDALERLFPDIDVWDDPDELCEAISALADEGIREQPNCDQVMACIDPVALVAMISNNPTACRDLASNIISADPGNTIRAGTDGKLFENDAVV